MYVKHFFIPLMIFQNPVCNNLLLTSSISFLGGDYLLFNGHQILLWQKHSKSLKRKSTLWSSTSLRYIYYISINVWYLYYEKNLVIDKYRYVTIGTLTFFVHQEIPCPMNWQLFPRFYSIELSEDSSSSKASFSDMCLLLLLELAPHDSSRGEVVENSRRISKSNNISDDDAESTWRPHRAKILLRKRPWT